MSASKTTTETPARHTPGPWAADTGYPAVVYSPTDAAIAELREQAEPLAAAEGPKGYDARRKVIATARTMRGQIEKARVQFKAGALEYGRKVDSEAKRLTAMIEAVEHPLKAINDGIDAEKARIAREKADAEAKAERDRLAAIAAEEAAKLKAEQDAIAAEREAEQNRVAEANRAESERLAVERKLVEQARAEAQAKIDAAAKIERDAKAKADRDAAEAASNERRAKAHLEASSPILLETCKAVLDAIESTNLNGVVIWIRPPYCAGGVHESASDRLAATIEYIAKGGAA